MSEAATWLALIRMPTCDPGLGRFGLVADNALNHFLSSGSRAAYIYPL